MLIVLEGSDCVGKSSLADEIAQVARRRGLTVVQEHKSAPQHSDPFTEYETPLVDYRPNHDTVVICDRWHWGEVIYGPRYRGRTILDWAGLRHVDMFLQTRGAVQVLLTASDDELVRRLGDRGDDLVNRDEITQIAREYRILVERVGDHVYVTQHHDDLANQLLLAAELAATRASQLPRTATYVGPRDVDWLLLGERRGIGPTRDWLENLPAFAPRPGTSGHFLITALESCPLTKSYGLVNALEDDWVDLHRCLGQPAVVTLGNQAHHEAQRLRVPHGRVQHPAYVKRFMHGHDADYATAIWEAAETGGRVWLA